MGGAVGLSTDNMNVLRNIAKMAYGAHIGEKENGGNGFLGAIIGEDGTPRIIKMLTHGGERDGLGKTAETMNAFLDANENNGKLRGFSDNVRTLLLKLADRAGMKDDIEALLKADGKPLMSRKIIASSVTAILAHGKLQENVDAFSWKDIKNDHAATMEHTSVTALLNDMDAIKSGGDTLREFSKVTDQTLYDDPHAVKTKADMIAKIKDGKFDRGWLKAARDARVLSDRFFSSIGCCGNTQVSPYPLLDELLVESSQPGFTSSNLADRIFLDAFKKELVKTLEGYGDKDTMPTHVSKLRLIKRAFIKAATVRFVFDQTAAALNKKGRSVSEARKSSALTDLRNRLLGEAGNNDPIEEFFLGLDADESVNDYAKYELQVVFGVGYVTSDEQIAGKQELIDYQKDLLAEDDSGASPWNAFLDNVDPGASASKWNGMMKRGVAQFLTKVQAFTAGFLEKDILEKNELKDYAFYADIEKSEDIF